MNPICEEQYDITFRNIFDTPYVQTLREWRNQDFVRKNMTNHAVITPEEHEEYMRGLEHSSTNKVFLAFYKGEPLAVITMKYNPEENYMEPGMYIINEKFLGKGFGIVMSYVRLEYIFTCLPEGRMRTLILEKNQTNRNLQEKMGCMLTERVMVQAQNGEEEPACVYYLTRQAWENNKAAIEERIAQNYDLARIGRIPV